MSRSGTKNKAVSGKGSVRRTPIREWVNETYRFKERALDESLSAVAMSDMQGNITYVNKACMKMWGSDNSEELLGKPYWVLVDTDQTVIKQIAESMFEKGSWEGETVAHNKEGEETVVRVYSGIIKDGQGNPIQTVSSFIDITEIKRVERELKQKEEYFRSLIENSLDAIVILNRDGTFRYQSPSIKHLLGFEPEERIGESSLDFAHPDDKSIIAESFARLIQDTTYTLHTEIRTKHKDGSWRALEIAGSNLLENPAIAGIVFNMRDITGRKEMEENLERSEKQFRALIENSTDAVAIIDGNGHIIYESPSYQRILGYKPEEHVGRSGFEDIHPDDIQAASGKFAELLAQPGGTIKAEVRIRHADGSWRSLEVTATNLLGESAINGIVCNYRDITERKEMEENLERNEKQFRALIENSADAVTIIGGNGNIIYLSPSYQRILGYKPEEHVGKSGFEDIHPDDIQAASGKFAELLAQPGGTIKTEVRIRHADGSWRSLEATAANLLEDPAVNGIVCNYRDITERKIAEEALHESEQQYSLLVGSLADAIFRYKDGVLTWGNDRIQEMLGYEKSEVIGEDVNIFVSDDVDLKELMKRVDKALKEGGHFEGTTRAKKKDESVIDIEYTASPVPGKEPLELVGVARDITGRVQMEEELRRNYDAQTVINSLLNLSLAEISIEGLLKRALDLILDVPWLTFESRGGILLVEDSPEVLVMKAQNGLAKQIRKKCALVPFGRCHCGRAASTQETQFSGCLDEHHQISYKGIIPHGHYCVPIVYAGETLGVLNIYVKEGHRYSKQEEQFLLSIANVLSGIIQRKKAEEALRESEEKFRQIFNGVNDDITFIDTQGVILDTNDRVLSMFGYLPEEIIGRSFTEIDLFEPGDLSRATDIMGGSVTESSMVTTLVEMKVKHKNGHKVPVEVSTNLVMSADGSPQGFVCIARDITERKKAEDLLRQSEEKFRQIFNGVNDEIVFIDTRGIVLDVNEKSMSMFGYPPEEVVGRNIMEIDLFDPDELVRTTGQIEESVARGSAITPLIEIQVKHKNGHKIPVEVSTSLIKAADGSPQGFVSIIRDITERKKAEIMLRESEERFKAIYNNAAEGMLIANVATGKFSMGNRKICEMLGYAEEEIRELGIMDTYPEEDLSYVVEQFERQARGEILVARDIPVMRKNGSVFYADISSAPVILDGETYILGLFTDITERKKAEEEQGKLNVEIAEKNKELEHIVYVSSHDLRSPLVNIQGFSKELNYSLQEMVAILQSEEIPTGVREKLSPIIETDVADSLTYIQASVLKMDSLLSGLLRLSRLGRAALNFEPLDINRMVSGIAKDFEYRVKGAKVTLEIGDMPSCIGDSVQVNQVFSNLVDNALKYLDLSRPGLIKITGRTEDDRAVYCIEDSGIGIAGEDQEKIFGLFQQLNPGASTGEGLGLSFVKKILSRNGGNIWVESEPGVGSKFFVSLPAARQ